MEEKFHSSFLLDVVECGDAMYSHHFRRHIVVVSSNMSLSEVHLEAIICKISTFNNHSLRQNSYVMLSLHAVCVNSTLCEDFSPLILLIPVCLFNNRNLLNNFAVGPTFTHPTM